MRPGREQLGDACCVEPGLGESNGGSETSTAGTDDDSVILVVYHIVLGVDGGNRGRGSSSSLVETSALGSRDP